MGSEALLIGGRSGVGKTSAAAALHELLSAEGVQHAVIEGDGLDLAYPAPHVAHPGFGLAERNLTAMWRNYRAVGHRRLVYTNTVAVLEVEVLTEAMGDRPLVTAVLLETSDAVTEERLGHRAGGTASGAEIVRSRRSAEELAAEVAPQVHRLDTTGLTAVEVARRLADLVRWS